MKIYDMKVNHLTNPLGFRMTRTVFSWKVKEAAGKRQTQARIRIASDQAMTDLLADTGWDAEADSLGYQVKSALDPVTRYYWTVSVQVMRGKKLSAKSSGLRQGRDSSRGLESGSPVTARKNATLILRKRLVWPKK